MKIKTKDLTGTTLDWAVAKALGFRFGYWQINNTSYVNVWAELLDDRGCGPAGYFPEDDRFQYSTSWAAGGPIIEREKICTLDTGDAAKWKAYRWQDDNFTPEQYGPTPLIAAMRCFVTSKLGDEVDVPEELT